MGLQRIIVRCHVLLLLSIAVSLNVNAAERQTFVASTGNDLNPCSRTAPCRSFTAAVAVPHSDGGEVVVLDSAGYGPVTINLPITLIAPPGVYAGVTATSGDAITVTAMQSVVLRGLAITGIGASNGIKVLGQAPLYVEGCVISGFKVSGIRLEEGGDFFLDDVLIRGNQCGLFMNTVGNSIKGSIDHSRFENGAYGIYAECWQAWRIQMAVRNSVIAGNTEAGVFARGVQLNVKNCIVANNNQGFYTDDPAGGGTLLGVSSSMVASNQVGFHSNGGTFNSFGDNQLIGNTTQTVGPIITVPHQ